MNRSFAALIVVAGLGAGGYFYYSSGDAEADSEKSASGGRGRASGGGGFGGPGFGGGPRPAQMTVDVSAVARADMSQQVIVVGNLIGAQTVDAVARVAGRLDAISVKLGDQVQRGQQVAKVEDREIVEQIKQAEASYEVSAATIRQREADLRLAQTNLDRTKSLFDRQLIPKQTFDDTDARYQAALAQLDLSRAQYAQAAARLDELKLSLGNTLILSPVTGFVSKRTLDPGAWVTANTSFMSFVDITTVRLVANIIEKDLRRVTKGMRADVTVDAFPGETFKGQIARISPVLDPATRTAQIEVEIDNPQFRLKPGMYAKVDLTVEHHPNTLVVPTNALVDLQGNRGVFLPAEGPNGRVARFHPIQVGLSDVKLSEVISGLSEGDKVVTTGAGALREGDKLVIPGAGREGGASARGRPVSGGWGGAPGPPSGAPLGTGSGDPASGARSSEGTRSGGSEGRTGGRHDATPRGTAGL